LGMQPEKGDSSMKRPLAAHWPLLCLVLAATAGSGGWAQQKYRLRDAEAAGDVAVVEGSQIIRMKLRVAPGGEEAREQSFGSVQTELYHQRVLTLGPNGAKTEQRAYAVSRTTEMGPKGDDVKVTSLQGKTVTIRRAGGKVTITPEKGRL